VEKIQFHRKLGEIGELTVDRIHKMDTIGAIDNTGKVAACGALAEMELV
jgi:hypothetical protein